MAGRVWLLAFLLMAFEFTGACQLRFMRIRFQNGTGADECILRLDSLASEGFDPNLEAYKLYGFGLNTSLVSEGTAFSIMAIPSLGSFRMIPLEVRSPSPGSYWLEFENLGTLLGASHTLSIRDNLLGTLQTILPGEVYPFSISGDAESQGANRFELVFSPVEVVGTALRHSREKSIVRVMWEEKYRRGTLFLPQLCLPGTRIRTVDYSGKSAPWISLNSASDPESGTPFVLPHPVMGPFWLEIETPEKKWVLPYF